MAYEKINRNSLGQFMRKLEKLVWISRPLVQGRSVTDPNGVVRHIPTTVSREGFTYVKER